MSKQILLIIPCYNEENRLEIKKIKSFISKNSHQIDFIFIDDGSSDATGCIIEENLVDNQNTYLIKLERNLGKGNALREGFLRNLNKPYQYFGFIDADMDIPFSQVNNLYNALSASDSLMAISKRNLVKNISIKNLRSISSIAMLLIANHIIAFKPGLNDTQCGCKLFKKDIAELCFKEKFISDWLFDIEIFLRLKIFDHEFRKAICEVPIKNINSSGDSKFKFRKNLRIIRELYQIKNHYK